MPSLPSSQYFQEVLEVSQAVLAVSGPPPLPSGIASSPTQLHTLHLPTPSDSLLRAALECRPLSSEVQDALCARFLVHGANLQRSIVTEYERTEALLQPTRPYAPNDADAMFSAATNQLWARAIDNLHQQVLELVDARVARFWADADAAALAQESNESSSEDEALVVPARGHSNYAVAVLEKAYDHTQTVTTAEKQRLAAATGLEARQVTIWFQNRRNRKTKEGNARYNTTPSGNKRKSRTPDEAEEHNRGESRPSPASSVSDKRQRISTNGSRRISNSGSVTSVSSQSSNNFSVDDDMWDLSSAAKARNPSSASDTTTDSSYMPATPVNSAHSPWDHKMDVASMCAPGVTTPEPVEAATGEMLLLDPYGPQLLDWNDLGLDAELESALSFNSPELLSFQMQITPQLASNEWSPPNDVVTPRQSSFGEVAHGKTRTVQLAETIMGWKKSDVSLASVIESKCSSEVSRNMFGASASGVPYLHVPAPAQAAVPGDVRNLFDDSFECWQPDSSALDSILRQWSTQPPADVEMADIHEQRLSEENLFAFTNLITA